jgi:hypothetical protein
MKLLALPVVAPARLMEPWDLQCALLYFLNFSSLLLEIAEGDFHDQGAEWIVIRGSLRGHNR